MANWKYRVELGDLHKQYQAGGLTIQQVAHGLAERLKKLSAYKRDSEFELIVDNFALFTDTEGVDDYDNYLAELYDWGDTEVAPYGKWPPNKQCWIASV